MGLCARKSAISSDEKPMSGAPTACDGCSTTSSRFAFSYGKPRSSTPLTRLKIALLAPMPSVRVMSAVAVKPGERIEGFALYIGCRGSPRRIARASQSHARVCAVRRDRLPRSPRHCRMRRPLPARACSRGTPAATDSRTRMSMWKSISEATSFFLPRSPMLSRNSRFIARSLEERRVCTRIPKSARGET